MDDKHFSKVFTYDDDGKEVDITLRVLDFMAHGDSLSVAVDKADIEVRQSIS